MYHTPSQQLLGSVTQEWSLLCSKFRVKNSHSQTVLYIKSPLIGVKFDVLAIDGVTKIGKIKKEWAGWIQETFTDADNFGLEFPVDLSVDMKALLLAATFLMVSDLLLYTLLLYY